MTASSQSALGPAETRSSGLAPSSAFERVGGGAKGTMAQRATKAVGGGVDRSRHGSEDVCL